VPCPFHRGWKACANGRSPGLPQVAEKVAWHSHFWLCAARRCNKSRAGLSRLQDPAMYLSIFPQLVPVGRRGLFQPVFRCRGAACCAPSRQPRCVLPPQSPHLASAKAAKPSHVTSPSAFWVKAQDSPGKRAFRPREQTRKNKGAFSPGFRSSPLLPIEIILQPRIPVGRGLVVQIRVCRAQPFKRLPLIRDPIM
jgi:hypothetical protein